MESVQDKFINRFLKEKTYVIDSLAIEHKLSEGDISLLDEAVNLFLFNIMVSFDGGNDFSEMFEFSFLDKLTGESVIDSNKIALHERLFELDDE